MRIRTFYPFKKTSFLIFIFLNMNAFLIIHTSNTEKKNLLPVKSTLRPEEAILDMEFNPSKSVNYVFIALGQRWEFIKVK